MERYEEDIGKLRGRVEGLRKDLARHNAHDRREPSRVEHAVKRALTCDNHTSAALPIIRYVKDKRVARRWARGAIVALVNEGVPISKIWPVTKAKADVLGVVIIGRWSTRTSGRVVHEAGIVAELMTMGYTLTCICLYPESLSLSLTHSNLAMTINSDRTSHKNIQFLSRHAAIVPLDDNPNPRDFFLGITPEVNRSNPRPASPCFQTPSK